VNLVDLRARSGDGPRLGLYVGRLVGQRSHLDLPLGARPGGSDGDRPKLVLRRDKLLLKRDVRGGEPLVVDEELLDVLVPGDEALLDKGADRVRGGCARGGGVRVLREDALIARRRGDGGRCGPWRPAGAVPSVDVGRAGGDCGIRGGDCSARVGGSRRVQGAGAVYKWVLIVSRDKSYGIQF
jgi:hypothetical protein